MKERAVGIIVDRCFWCLLSVAIDLPSRHSAGVLCWWSVVAVCNRCIAPGCGA
jgi:hypothetical protein